MGKTFSVGKVHFSILLQTGSVEVGVTSGSHLLPCDHSSFFLTFFSHHAPLCFPVPY